MTLDVPQVNAIPMDDVPIIHYHLRTPATLKLRLPFGYNFLLRALSSLVKLLLPKQDSFNCTAQFAFRIADKEALHTGGGILDTGLHCNVVSRQFVQQILGNKPTYTEQLPFPIFRTLDNCEFNSRGAIKLRFKLGVPNWPPKFIEATFYISDHALPDLDFIIGHSTIRQNFRLLPVGAPGLGLTVQMPKPLPQDVRQRNEQEIARVAAEQAAMIAAATRSSSSSSTSASSMN